MRSRDIVSHALNNETYTWRVPDGDMAVKSVGDIKRCSAFNPAERSLLLKIEELELFNGLLRKPDRRPVAAVVEYLQDKGLSVYLGGSVVRYALAGRPRQYDDVDLLSIGNLEDVVDVYRDMMGDEVPFNYNRVKFKKAGQFRNLYMGMDTVLNHRIEVVAPEDSKTSVIDLSLTTRRHFNKYTK